MKRIGVYLLFGIVIFSLVACGTRQVKVVGEYKDISKLGLSFIQNEDKAYDIGADEEGMPIFKDYKAAYKQAKSDFAVGFKYLQKEYELEPITQTNWEAYENYGWQVTTTDEEIKKQCGMITSFLDIYENSYK